MIIKNGEVIAIDSIKTDAAVFGGDGVATPLTLNLNGKQNAPYGYNPKTKKWVPVNIPECTSIHNDTLIGTGTEFMPLSISEQVLSDINQGKIAKTWIDDNKDSVVCKAELTELAEDIKTLENRLDAVVSEKTGVTDIVTKLAEDLRVLTEDLDNLNYNFEQEIDARIKGDKATTHIEVVSDLSEVTNPVEGNIYFVCKK